MSWSDPSTQATGDFITAAIWNVLVADLILVGPHYCLLTRSGTNTVSASTPTKAVLDTATVDTDSFLDSGNGRFHVPSGLAGTYLLIGTHGMDVAGRAGFYNGSAGYYGGASVVRVVTLAVADYIELYEYTTTSGGATSLGNSTGFGPYLFAMQIPA